MLAGKVYATEHLERAEWMNTSLVFYICPTCFFACEIPDDDHEHALLQVDPGLPGDESRKPMTDPNGHILSTATRWFNESVIQRRLLTIPDVYFSIVEISTMNEQDKRNIEAARKMYTGEETERATLAANIIWHVPGHNPVSGEYHGFEEYTKLMPSRMAPLNSWEFEVHDVMANGSYVVATISLRGERKNKKVDLRGAHIMRMNDQGQVVEGWGFTSDQDALDDFFSA